MRREEKLLAEISKSSSTRPTHTKIGATAPASLWPRTRHHRQGWPPHFGKNKVRHGRGIGHHDMATKCLRDAMDADAEPDGDENDIQDESKVIPPSRPPIVVDEDASLSPEQRGSRSPRSQGFTPKNE
jgi:hypothetical protein